MTVRRVVVAGAALAFACAPCLGQGQPAFQVIVSRDNLVGTVSVSAVSEMFLKKTARWPSGAAIEPVDLSGEPEVREAFSREIHARTTSNIKSFWNQEVFSGRAVPPPELGNSLEVARYVASHPGAIGYVAAGTPLDGVRAVDVLVPPRLYRRVEPELPASAVAARVSGDVVLSVVVDKDGRVSRTTVVRDLPFGVGQEAARAVEKWRFDPATVNGRPVAQAIEVTVHIAPPR